MNFSKSRLFKRLLAAALSLALVCGNAAFFSIGDDVYAETVSEMQSKIGELDESKKQLKAKVDALQGEIDEQQAYVDTLNAYITTVENKIIACENLLSTYQAEVDKLDSDIEKQNEALAENKELFKRRIRSIYMSGSNTSMSILLGSDKFADYLSMSQFTEGLAKYDQALMEKINIAIEDIEKTKKKKSAAIKKQKKVKEQLAADRSDLQQQQSVAAEQLSEVSKSQQELNDELSAIDAKKSELETKIDAAYEAARQAALKKQQEEEERKRQEEAEKAEKNNTDKENASSDDENKYENKAENNGDKNSDDKGTSSSYSSASYIWPLPGYYTLTSYFGNRFDPYYQIYRGHKGIDISGGGVAGKPIIATADGTVTVAEFNDGGYGNYVVISHGFKKGKLLTSHYGHMVRYAVSVGQEVKQGDVIGYVGTTGASTGYHLHFEMREDNTPVDPLGYVSY